MALSRTRAALCLSAAALAVPALASPGASAPAPTVERTVAARAAAASMDYTPKRFVGGQRLTFTGNIGARGKRVIRLQVHMGRTGDTWNTIDDFKRTTTRSGSFSFTYQAPSMRDKAMRVIGKGGYKTPAREFNALSQDLLVQGPDEAPVAGQPFDIRVDTAPYVEGRPDLPGPVFPGRELTLQRRDLGDGPAGYASPWTTVAGGVLTNSNGIGVFEGVTVADPGAVVYRVRQENWTRNGDEIGWFASFPTCVDVRVSEDADATGCPTVERSSTSFGRTAVVPHARGGAAGSTTAGVKYGWAPALWDFGWAYGQSLDSEPQRGRDAHGHWLDWSDGSGRALMHNGQLKLDTQRELQRFAGSRGTTMVTLQDNPMRYGRWEVRQRAESWDQAEVPGRARIELVPARAEDYDCGAHNITIADYNPLQRSVRLAARGNGQEWSRTIDGITLQDTNHAWGIEVGKDHLTWFREGQPIGYLKDPAVVPSVPMTVRMSIVGDGQRTINRTQTYYDWVRAYSMEFGKQVRTGGGFRASAWTGGC